jgi:hypothetical protein
MTKARTSAATAGTVIAAVGVLQHRPLVAHPHGALGRGHLLALEAAAPQRPLDAARRLHERVVVGLRRRRVEHCSHRERSRRSCPHDPFQRGLSLRALAARAVVLRVLAPQQRRVAAVVLDRRGGATHAHCRLRRRRLQQRREQTCQQKQRATTTLPHVSGAAG